MIKVTIIDNGQVVRSIMKKECENIRVAWAQEGERSLGYCAFSTDGELLSIRDKDEISELLLRAALNSLDLNGVKTAFCHNPELFPALFALGFRQSGGRLETDIPSFFEKKCR